MKRTVDLNKQAENTETREAVREAIAAAGMQLTDEELDQVGGGYVGGGGNITQGPTYFCKDCQTEFTVVGLCIFGDVPCRNCGSTNTSKVSGGSDQLFV